MSNEINLLTNFDFGGFPVRVVGSFDEPWFVAKDVAESLDMVWNKSLTIKHVPAEWRGAYRICPPGGVTSDVTPSELVYAVHIPASDDDEKGVGTTGTLGGVQEMLVLSEQGLYFFLGRSDKPKALPFQKWLAGEVLPEIRKTGGYVHDVELFLTHQIMRDLDARSLERVTKNFDQVLRHHVYPKVRAKHGSTSLVEAVLSDTKRELLNYYPDSSGEIKPLPHSRRKSSPSIFIIPGDSVAVLTNAYRMKYKHVDNPLESLEEYIARNGERPVGGVKP